MENANSLVQTIILLGYIYICTEHLSKKLKITDKTIEMFRPDKTVKGFELVFISKIDKERYSIEDVNNQEIQSVFSTENFNLNYLSISRGTYIASGIETFIVKIKH